MDKDSKQMIFVMDRKKGEKLTELCKKKKPKIATRLREFAEKLLTELESEQ